MQSWDAAEEMRNKDGADANEYALAVCFLLYFLTRPSDTLYQIYLLSLCLASLFLCIFTGILLTNACRLKQTACVWLVRRSIIARCFSGAAETPPGKHMF
jgi:hypothetical protein